MTPPGGGTSTPRVVIPPGESPIPLRDAAEARYLNYALSVITSRALPDVRDGLKPVQRRILFTMWQQRLTSDAKHRKSATVVGEVMGRYHPHGDSAIYDALVRMAQPWVMRMPLIEGSGNFGSLDDDPPAAMRYTECRLAPIAAELLDDIDRDTVHFRPSFDGTREEPVVLPARLPVLLVNGSTGIAVGMATNIPPHNPIEVCKALLKLLDNPELLSYQLVANDAIQGPDFPTGGEITTGRDALRELYKTGQGPVNIRATWEYIEGKGRGPAELFITSVPYATNKASIVEQVGRLVEDRKLPQVTDVKDLSTDDVRIQLILKRDADPNKVMAFLFKHTPLQGAFNVNLTCLLPIEDNPDVGRPERCDLREVLWSFLKFRLEVVTRRLSNELASLEKRLHTLEGFAFAFDVLDEIIAIIRKSEGKADAAAKLLARFGVEGEGAGNGGLDAEQIDAILELRLYRLARLEINIIREELDAKAARAAEVRTLLDETEATGRWGIVRSEIEELIKKYGKLPENRRRSILAGDAEILEYNEEDFIVNEDAQVVVTADGWIKRQREINPETTRLREGDRILALAAGSTRATIAFFSSLGVCYTARIADVPATTGYGEPVQKFFKMKDRERIVAAASLDPRTIGPILPSEDSPDEPPTVHAVAVTTDGYALRFSLAPFVDPSKNTGRKYARPSKGAEVLTVETIDAGETLIVASRRCRALLCPVSEINFLAGPGKGVIAIKLDKDDSLLAARTAVDDRDTLTVKTSMGGEQRINTAKYQPTGRGGKGHEVIKRGSFIEVVPEEVRPPMELEAAR